MGAVPVERGLDVVDPLEKLHSRSFTRVVKEHEMPTRTDCDLSVRISALERQCARQWVMLIVALLVGTIMGFILSWQVPEVFAQTRRTDEILTVRGLIVVDERGIERVRLGSPLPDPIVKGKRLPRQGVVSGMLIFDADGDERGGYVTSDTNGDAFLTLDAKKGQQTIFIANRDGGANLSVWSGDNRNDNYVSVRAVPTPLIEIVQNGKRVFTAGGSDTSSK
jgi:hypothetical protein